MANKITVPLRGGRFEGTTFTFTQKKNGTVLVSWSDSGEQIRIRQTKGKSVTLEDGTRFECDPGSYVAYLIEGGKNMGALGFASTAKGAFVEHYDIIW